MTAKNFFLELATEYLGKEYRWGGDDPINGFDCSGFVIELAKSVGLMRENEDYTANMLANKYKEVTELKPGNLVFWDWNRDGVIDHVEIVLTKLDDGTVLSIGASGGDSRSTSAQRAAAQNAYIKIRPLRERYVKIVDLFA